jgi:NADH-quinone oxidoreductase subunit I
MFGLVGRAVESLYYVCVGLWTVAKHTGRAPITKEFPDTMPDLPGAFRGRLALAVNPETSEHLCISCRQCERVCPDKCIDITAHKSPETGKLELIDFKIDHGLCMFCGLCTEVCPTTCIINTNDFEMSDYSREALIYDLKKLTLTQDESAHYFSKKYLPIPKPKPKPAPKPAAAAAKPADGVAAPAKPAPPAAKPAEGAAAAKSAPAATDKPAGDAAATKPTAEKKADDSKDSEKEKAAPEPSAAEGKAEPDKTEG